MCVTSSRLQDRDPEISYVDADGDVFEDRVAFDGIPRLWPRQAPPGAQWVQRGGGTEVLEGGGWRVETSDWGPFAPAAGEVAHELGVQETSVPVRPIAGSVLGRRHGFELASRAGVWAAVATCGSFAVTVEGRGGPPT